MSRLLKCSIVIELLCVLLIGCGKPPPPSPQLFVNTIPEEMCGNEVEFERRTLAINTQGGGGTLAVSSDDNRLRIDKGKVTLNDKEYGTVEKGDRIKVTAEGRLFVNGAERRP